MRSKWHFIFFGILSQNFLFFWPPSPNPNNLSILQLPVMVCVSHIVPFHPCLQWQANESEIIELKHVPPFKHGLFWHEFDTFKRKKNSFYYSLYLLFHQILLLTLAIKPEEFFFTQALVIFPSCFPANSAVLTRIFRAKLDCFLKMNFKKIKQN